MGVYFTDTGCFHLRYLVEAARQVVHVSLLFQDLASAVCGSGNTELLTHKGVAVEAHVRLCTDCPAAWSIFDLAAGQETLLALGVPALCGILFDSQHIAHFSCHKVRAGLCS